MALNHGYLIALGSNQRHPRFGDPHAVLEAAVAAMAAAGLDVLATSPVMRSRPLGPSLRVFANGVAVVESPDDPPVLLALLQQIERSFGRTKRGQRWRARVLDLDIILWSGGAWSDAQVTIPHPEFRNRDFVLRPSALVAPDLRDPITGFTLRQLCHRLTRARPAPNGRRIGAGP